MEIERSKILVTGGSGFVAAYLIRLLLDRGVQVSATIREDSDLSLLGDVQDKITLFRTDINDIIGMENAIAGNDIVIHTAGLVSFVPEDRRRLIKINVEGTANVVNLCLSENVKKLVYVSSIAALGRTKKDKLINEEQKWIPDPLNTTYAWSKYLGELEAWRGLQEGLDVSVINPSLIIGAGHFDKGSSSLIRKVAEGLPFFPAGKNGIVDVRDVASMIISLIEKGKKGERYICSAENMTYADLFTKMADELNVKAAKRKLSPLLAAIGWRFYKLAAMFTGKRPVITRESLKTSMNSFNYDNHKSISELAFSYRSPETTIRDACLAYLQSENNGKAYGVMQT